MDEIGNTISNIKQQLESISTNSPMHHVAPKLIAVTKGQPIEKIRAACVTGHMDFGENKVQEAYTHWHSLKQEFPKTQLHLIGPLQSNKCADAVTLFDVIHTIDREKIARALADEMHKQQRFLPCFIQVNTGEEPQKAGVLPSELPGLLNLCKSLGLPVVGLMCIPPADVPASPHFAFLHKLASEHGLAQLSMGMSSDYKEAARLGATYVRIGTAIFGERS